MLFSRFHINYNNEPEMFRKGSVVFRDVSATGVLSLGDALTVDSMNLSTRGATSSATRWTLPSRCDRQRRSQTRTRGGGQRPGWWWSTWTSSRTTFGTDGRGYCQIGRGRRPRNRKSMPGIGYQTLSGECKLNAGECCCPVASTCPVFSTTWPLCPAFCAVCPASLRADGVFLRRHRRHSCPD